MIVALADQPLIDEQDIIALIGAFKKRGDASMVVPRVAASMAARRAGQPGDLRRRAARGVAGRRVPTSRAASGAHRASRARALVRHRQPALPLDIDTPEDLERFAATTGHTLQWPANFAREAVA